MRTRSWLARRRKRTLGVSLTEMTIATSLFVGTIAVGLPVFKSIGDAGDEGSAQISAQCENQKALLQLANELQNASTTAVDEFDNPRLFVSVGEAPTPILDARTNDLGGFRGRLGAHQGHGVVGSGATQNAEQVEGNAVTTGTHGTEEELAAGLGGAHDGGSRLGRIRGDDLKGAAIVNTVATRPRHASLATNAILRFQKVEDYTIDGTGSPVITWGPQIRYQVANNRLIRTESGQDRVIARHVVGFGAVVTDSGTLLMTLVTQKQSSATGRVQYQANQIEVSPKN